MVKYLISSFLSAVCSLSCLAAADGALRFDPTAFTVSSITMPGGEIVRFKAYESIFYVTDIEDLFNWIGSVMGC